MLRGLLIPLLVLLLALLVPGAFFVAGYLYKTGHEHQGSLRPIASHVSLSGVHVSVVGAEVSGSTLLVRLRVQLPNPCYKVQDVNVETENGRANIVVRVSPPEKTTICIQVVPMPAYYSAVIPVTSTPLQVDLTLIVGGQEKTIEILVLS